MLLLAMMALMAMTACTTDEPNPTIMDYDNNQDLPLFEYDRTKDFAFWPTPTIDDSELQGGGYDFAYWQQHKAEAENVEELMAMCNIPKDLLANMSTHNLAITCFNYPYIGTFYASSSDCYKAFQYYVSCFNGYAELMKRYGGVQATLDMFAESTQYSSSFISYTAWAFFVCTAVDHKVLSAEQLKSLSQVVVSRINDAEMESMNLAFTYLLGAFIAYHYDTTLPDEQLYLLKVYIQSSTHLTPIGKPVDRISTIIESSLNRLGSVD
jgi:hypothetical protein